MHELMEKNLIVSTLARKYGKGVVATTDSHTGHMGAVYTLAKGETFRELFDNIQKGRSYIVVEGGTRRHLTKEISSWVELAFSTDRQVRKERDFTLKVSYYDWLITYFANERVSEFPKINNLFKGIFQNFSRSGLPTYMHMRAEKTLVSLIEKSLNQTASAV